jgi:hypothetical protein
MAHDKIFNNTYGEGEFDNSTMSFKVEASYEDTTDPEDKIHYEILMNRVDTLVKKSEFKNLSKVTATGVTKKLNKVQINQVFFFIIDKIGKDYKRVELFGALSDYFDVFPNKFYSSLSNKFKDELIQELDGKYDIIAKKNIRKLF